MTESMELDLNDELIRAAHFQSMEAHKERLSTTLQETWYFIIINGGFDLCI